MNTLAPPMRTDPQRCICETAVELAKSMVSDPRFTAWQENALRHGIEGAAGINNLLIDIACVFEEIWRQYEAHEPDWYLAVDAVSEWLFAATFWLDVHDQAYVKARLMRCIGQNV